MRQGYIFQAKQQDKSLGKDLNEVDISNLPHKEFKVMVIKLLTSGEEWMNTVRTSIKR